MISHLHKVIYVHIHKTGGSSIEAALDREEQVNQTPSGAVASVRGKHMTAAQIRAVVGPDVWESYFKFSVVRNPWDRVHSYWWSTARKRTGQPFPDWLAEQELGRQHWSRPQAEWLRTSYGLIEMEFIGRFEVLEQDFHRMCQTANIAPRELPHILNRNTPGRPHYRDSYTGEHRKLIENFYHEDIERWEYRYAD